MGWKSQKVRIRKADGMGNAQSTPEASPGKKLLSIGCQLSAWHTDNGRLASDPFVSRESRLKIVEITLLIVCCSTRAVFARSRLSGLYVMLKPQKLFKLSRVVGSDEKIETALTSRSTAIHPYP